MEKNEKLSLVEKIPLDAMYGGCIIAPMIRFSISVSKPQYEYLLGCSQKFGISIGELIRRAIDEWREENHEKDEP